MHQRRSLDPYPCFAAPIATAHFCRRRSPLSMTTPDNTSRAMSSAPDPPPAPSSLSPSSSSPSPSPRSRPRLDHTSSFPTPETISLTTIGTVHSPYKERFGTPRQPTVSTHTLGDAPQPARIVFKPGHRYNLALRGLGAFDYAWVLSYFHLNQGWNPLIRPPRGPKTKHGVFATRAPHRPNSVGLSCVRITSVDEDAGVVHFLGCDLLDGTAVFDIKPYVPYCDAFPDARAGWLDDLDQDMNAPDTLGYSPPPPHLTTALTDTQTATTNGGKEGVDDDPPAPPVL